MMALKVSKIFVKQLSTEKLLTNTIYTPIRKDRNNNM